MGTSNSTRPVTETHRLRIVGVCADRQIQALAMRLIRSLVIRTGSGTRALVRWLSFSQLNDRPSIVSANDWIAEADMFWFAGDSEIDIPGTVLELLGEWCRNQRSDGAIVALLRTSFDPRRSSSTPAENLLRQTASEARRPLFLRRTIWARPIPHSRFRVGRRPIVLEPARSDPAKIRMAPAESVPLKLKKSPISSPLLRGVPLQGHGRI